MKNRKFAIFILSHKRANKVVTYNVLRKQGYTGPIYIICDDEDPTYDDYVKEYGKQVIMFSKAKIEKTFDTGDNFGKRGTITHARNACFGIAEDLGLDYFQELDDDYTGFYHRYNSEGVYGNWLIKDYDAVVTAMLDYFERIPAVTIAMAQGGDFIGGEEGSEAKKIHMKRKSMNTFFLTPKRRFSFFGTFNEDVNTYVRLGTQGKLFLQVNMISVSQKTSQSNSGGITELYLDSGTYVKAFYTVMMNPSCVKVSVMGTKHPRLHHKISWQKAVPCILDEKYKK